MKTTATAWNLALAGLVAAVCMALAAPLVWADGYVRIEADSDGRYNVGVGYSSDNNDYYDDDYGSWYEDELAPYGRWRYVESLRTEIWFPYVDDTWRPYTDGHWINTKHGWTWVAYEPWGEIPHHFGRWVYLKRAGWGWVPGDEWGPAWVTWGVADGHIGWAPVPPANWVYNDRFDYGYCGNVDYGYGSDFGYHRSGLDFNLWVFVSNGRFYDSHVRLHLASAGRGAGWFHARRVLPIGPRLHSHYVSRYCSTPIRTVVVDRYNHRYGERNVAYYKPHGQTQKIKERGKYGVYTKRQPAYRAHSKRNLDKNRNAKIVPKSNYDSKRSTRAKTQVTRYKSGDTRSNTRSKSQVDRYKTGSTRSKTQATRSQKRAAPSKSQVTRSKSNSTRSKAQVTRSQKRAAPSKSQVTRSKSNSTRSKAQVTPSQKRSAPSKTTVAKRSSSRDNTSAKRSSKKRR